MNKTLQHYRNLIQSHQVNPIRRWDGQTTQSLLDCRDDNVPLLVLSLDAFALSDQPVKIETGPREWVIVPIEGRWQAEVTAGGRREIFAGERAGGPLAAWPGGCNAQAVYAPRQARLALSGAGEAIGFSGPAFADKPAAQVAAGPDRPLLARGSSVWRRDVVTLAGPNDLTTNLVVGETYSPPGLWSGTPLHVHDEQAADQSDHEEIYYHLARGGDGWGPYGVQLLFDDQGLDQAYMVHHRTAFAIPGGAHPVVAGPNGEMLYVWCLASESSQPLAMRDVDEFAWLKRVGQIVDDLSAERGASILPRSRLESLVEAAGLTPSQRRVLESHLRLAGIEATA